MFELTHTDKHSRARAGIIHTDHGDIETPMFMPVGTQAAVKTLDSFDLEKIGAQIILGNTYHLHLRPGENTVGELGGLHKFMNWSGPILTDSGGFQVFSLSRRKVGIPAYAPAGSIIESGETIDGSQGRLVKIDDEGVTFRSHIDGSKHRFTPESSIDIQHKLGADIIMAFDECTPDDADYDYTKKAMERTHRWAERCLVRHKAVSLKPYSHKQYLFGIVQGANHRELREESARTICSMDFDGIAIGGESVGYNMEATKEILDWVGPYLPGDRPHYAMGVGLDPADLLEVVERGVDMFDCVAPTRLARHGMLFTCAGDKHRLNIKNAAFARDQRPIDENCACPTCQNYSRAYLHHLFLAEEMTGQRLASIHNLYFMIDLMKQARRAIVEDKFTKFKINFDRS